MEYTIHTIDEALPSLGYYELCELYEDAWHQSISSMASDERKAEALEIKNKLGAEIKSRPEHK